MPMDKIEELLKRTIGLNAESVGRTLIEGAVGQRLAACGLRDVDSYLEKVRSCGTELQELIEAVVVSETWFFRDPAAFVALGQFVVQEWLPSHLNNKLRLLSIPCATGEEAYSLAMTLDGIGLPAESFHIDAVDISDRALTRARKAIYGKNSFRSENLEFRDRYFEPVPEGYRLSEDIRHRLNFHQGNLLSPHFLPDAPHFDFIFCRNLLIYLDLAAQNRAIQVLKRLLAPEGVLFVGPAEAALMLNHHLVSLKRSLAFAFRHGPAVSRKHMVEKKDSLPKKRPPAPLVPVVKPRSHEKTQRIPAVSRHTVKVGVDLKLANRLADEGRLQDALKVCEHYLKEHQSSVEAFYLLGVVHDAMGNRPKAEASYRKVLYLDPEHYDSLMHLAYSVEKDGDVASAKNLRARAQRAKERKQHA
jgi:chemotaxis protein methyltransferase WspC